MLVRSIARILACASLLAATHTAQTSQLVTVRRGAGGVIVSPDFNCAGAGNTVRITNAFGASIGVDFNMTGVVTIANGASRSFNAKAATNDFYDAIELMNPLNNDRGDERNNCKAGTSTAFNGSGVNASILTSVSLPHTGRDWSVALDCTGASPAQVAVFHLDFSGVPVSPFTGPRGEVLVDLAPATCIVFAAPHGGGTATLGPLPLPIDPALACLAYRVQGLCGDASLGFLSNALDEVVGR